MGKGDHRSRKGKIWRGSFGKSRPTKRNLRLGRKAREAAAKQQNA